MLGSHFVLPSSQWLHKVLNPMHPVLPILFLAITLVLVQSANQAFAQHSDIAINVADGQLTVNESLFLADFRVGLADEDGVLELRNPGYVTERANRLLPKTWLGFEIVGPLLFSDGTEWRPAESTAYLEFYRPFVENHSAVATGQSRSQEGFELAQADERGFVHEHIWFRLGNLESGPTPHGVYAIQQVITSPNYTRSDPFLLVFNHGLETPGFIQSVIAARQIIADSPFDCTGDGLLMASDLACVNDITQRDNVLRAIGSIQGDLDGNGRVEFSDFLILSRNFGTDETSYAAGNIDLVDGVGFTDFLALSRNFGPVNGARLANIPEPGGRYSVAFMVILFLICHRRHRN